MRDKNFAVIFVMIKLTQVDILLVHDSLVAVVWIFHGVVGVIRDKRSGIFPFSLV